MASSKRRLAGCEPLEGRLVMSAMSVLDVNEPFAQPTLSTLAAVTNPTPRGYTPSQIAQAYGFSGITLAGGIKGDGTGQTIAIVDAYNDPNILSDLHTFDRTFGLADPPKFSVVNQTGGSRLPATDAGWSEEIALDVEWAHAMAPGANILLVEANSSSLGDLLSAVNYARNAPGVSVVSMSWGGYEFSSERAYDQYFTTPAGHSGVTFIASAGDSGAQGLWPAVSPNVMSVGGTALSISGGTTYAGESAWGGSGGGYSRYESEPSWQRSVQTTGLRTGPDVSYNASPNTGFAVYDTVAVGGRTGWFQIGGTSAGAPQWAALVAIANQGRALQGKAALSNAQSLLYSLPSSDFHDVTVGSNGYSARAGYDLVTGRGTPVAGAVVRDLVGLVSSATTSLAAASQSSGIVFVFRRFGLEFDESTASLNDVAADSAHDAAGLLATTVPAGDGESTLVALHPSAAFQLPVAPLVARVLGPTASGALAQVERPEIGSAARASTPPAARPVEQSPHASSAHESSALWEAVSNACFENLDWLAAVEPPLAQMAAPWGDSPESEGPILAIALAIVAGYRRGEQSDEHGPRLTLKAKPTGMSRPGRRGICRMNDSL